MKKHLLIAAGIAATMMAASCSNNNDDVVKGASAPEDGIVCLEQILDGCYDIANEVGEAKIGDPLNLYNDGKQEEALYAVESWYSWHSRDDYSNNIVSIRNSYYGVTSKSYTTAPTASRNSLYALVAELNPTLNAQMVADIQAAITAIQSIPQPFRNNINSAEAKAAQEACADLAETIRSIKGVLQKSSLTNEQMDPVISQYVDAIILPTYKDLKDKNAAMLAAAEAFQKDPSDANFKKCCDAWMAAREPWETSEAFLFGPVDSEGLDPNMDSWPLDVNEIYNVLKSGKFDDLAIGEGDNDDAVEAKQAIRGFHTLEYLIYKDGNPRTINVADPSTEPKNLDYSKELAASWGNYMVNVAKLLAQDAADLYEYWSKDYNGNGPFAEQFKSYEF